ncbi:MAG: hypothetical protein JWQ62_1572, partial [Lacunisphaera sp.]|nr:hypothetical protein [Lacunisphaera sp.]
VVGAAAAGVSAVADGAGADFEPTGVFAPTGPFEPTALNPGMISVWPARTSTGR